MGNKTLTSALNKVTGTIEDPGDKYPSEQRGHGTWGYTVNNYLRRIRECDKTFTRVKLGKKELGLDGAEEIYLCLQNNLLIQHLDLSDNTLVGRSFERIAHCLYENEHLTSINLSDNAVGTDIKFLVEPLLHNNTLTTLQLRGVGLTAKCCSWVADIIQFNNTITDLDLSNNKIKADGCKELGSALGHTFTLHRLLLGNNEMEDKGMKNLSAGLMHNKSLRILDVSQNCISQSGIKSFVSTLEDVRCKLQVLDLSDNVLLHDGVQDLVEHLPHLREMTVLSLRNNGIAEKGMILLKEGYCNPLCDGIALNSLDISENGIKEADGIEALVSMLQVRTELTQLDITANELGVEGGALLLDTLKNNTTLTTLNYAATNLSSEQSKEITTIIENNRKAAGNPALGGASRRGRSRAKFGLTHQPSEEIKKLVSTAITNIALDSSFSLYCKEFNRLPLLPLCQAIAHFRGLVCLDMSCCDLGAEDGLLLFGALAHRGIVQQINLSSNPLTPYCVDGCVKMMNKATNLHTLYLADTDLSDAACGLILQAAANHPALKVLSLEWNNLYSGDEVANLLNKNKHLTTLYLNGNRLGSSSISSICYSLAESTSLTSLELVLTGMDNKGAEELHEALQKATQLCHLLIYRNVITEEYLRDINDLMNKRDPKKNDHVRISEFKKVPYPLSLAS